ncbi:hypothetical protein [Sphingomonas sp.]|uniref:hypothetical protein n=1 Tax=Sphingomonas sp. TaxID=28214 RepID=UPI00286A533E|nr:hypothetical protein [Sphingomonas sp.]
MRFILGVGLIVSIGACSNPATQAPVDLQPGLYDVVATGESYVEIEASATRANICVTDFDSREFERFPMVHATRRRNDCVDTVEPRQGNLVLGKRRCAATFRGNDESNWTYRLELRPTQFRIQGMVKDHEDGSGSETGPFTVVGTRTGDC